MYEITTEIVGGEIYQYHPLGDHVVRTVGVCGGRPTFKYTRIEITGTLDRLAAGESIEEIVAGYRGRVSHDAIIEAKNLASDRFVNCKFVAAVAINHHPGHPRHRAGGFFRNENLYHGR